LVFFWLIFEFSICVAWNSLPSVRDKSVKFPLSYRNIVCCFYCATLSHKVYVLDVRVLLLHVKHHACQFDLASFFGCLKWQNWVLDFLKTPRTGEIGKVGVDLNFSSTSHNPSFDGFTHYPTSWGTCANFSRLFQISSVAKWGHLFQISSIVQHSQIRSIPLIIFSVLPHIQRLGLVNTSGNMIDELIFIH
jgi:hypothetical protein